MCVFFFFFKQKTAYEMRISDWSSDVCSSDLSLGLLLDNPLSGITNTSTTIQRLRDNEPHNGGQYGAAFKYYAENLGSGTELGFYFENYQIGRASCRERVCQYV